MRLLRAWKENPFAPRNTPCLCSLGTTRGAAQSFRGTATEPHVPRVRRPCVALAWPEAQNTRGVATGPKREPALPRHASWASRNPNTAFPCWWQHQALTRWCYKFSILVHVLNSVGKSRTKK